MQEFRVKYLDLPDDLLSITKAVKEDEPSFDKKDAPVFNGTSYLRAFDRQIDPVILCLFYGLYKSKRLPENIPSIKFNNTREFNANISKPIEQFNNLLYALWIKENGIPERASDLLKYRKKLYDFLKYIQDYNQTVSTIIPFYLSVADEIDGDRSFINRVKHSGFCRYETSDMTPEYIGLVFLQAQEDFLDHIRVNEIVEKMKSSNVNLERDEKEKMSKTEHQKTIEEQIDRLELTLRRFLHEKISEQYPNYWDNIEKCVDLKTRADDRIADYLRKNPNERREAINPFDFMTFYDYSKIVTREFWPIFQETIRSRSDLESYIGQITEVRNALKHNRALSELENKKADLALTWFATVLAASKK